jgi:tetratricopeptide (TPR) repeat protein
MKQRLFILSVSLALARCVLAQQPPLDRAEILGELAQGHSASYLGHLVQLRGINFTPTADFLDQVRLSGGEGILIERIRSAEPPVGSSAAKNEHPFDRLAKCSELIHIGAIEQAASECGAAIDENSESAWPILLSLRVLAENGITPEERVQLLRRAIAVAPDLVDAHRALAGEDISDDERNAELQKVATLERAQPLSGFGAPDASIFDRWPSEPSSSHDLTLETQEQLRADLQTSLRDYPDLAAAHLAAAFALVRLGATENARAEIREAVRLEPGNPELHLALGRFYQSQRQAEGELAEFRTAVSLAPCQNLPRRYLAEALLRERHPDEAIEQWKEFLALSPRDLAASNALTAIYLDRRDRAAAIVEIRRSLKASSDVAASEADFVEARLNDLDRLARLLAKDGQFDAAAQQYAYLLRFKPDSSELHSNLGNVYSAQRNCSEAVGEYREAIRLEADSPNAHQNLANCLLVTRKTEEAISEYREVLELDPTSHSSRAMLGAALTQKGELNAAIEQYQQYLAEDPNSAEVLTGLAHAHYLNRDYGAAIMELKKALSVKPEFPAAESELALIYGSADDPHFRNPGEALRLARHAAVQKPQPVPESLDTLAEALARNAESDR